MWYIWLIAAGVFLAIEISTPTFMMFWFALGSLLAMVSSFFTDNTIVQAVIFLVSSTVLVIFTKPLTDKYVNNKETKPTNTRTSH